MRQAVFVGLLYLILSGNSLVAQQPGAKTTNSDGSAFLLTVLAALLGGGAMGAVISSLTSQEKARRDLRIDFVRQQLQKLYGPILFHMTNSERVQGHQSLLDSLYKTEFIDKNWHESARESVNKDAMQTIELKNRYCDIWTRNNKCVVAIIQENYYLSEQDDRELFEMFALDVIRLEIEHPKVEQDRKSKVPMLLNFELPRIKMYDGEFTKHIRQKFNAKTSELNKYASSPDFEK